MNWTIEFTEEFARGAKILKKRYKSFKHDLEDFKDSIAKNPFQGAELVPGIRKVRMAIESKGKGKAGGARVITLTYYVSEGSGKVHFLIIYDKSDADTVLILQNFRNRNYSLPEKKISEKKFGGLEKKDYFCSR